MIPLDLKADDKKLRQFAWFSLVGFGVLGAVAYFHWHSPTAAMVLWGLAMVTPVLGLISPKLVKPIYYLLTLIAFPIGLVVSNVIVAIMFYGIFTPVALFFRLIKRDKLNRTLSDQAETYWEERGPERPPGDYYRQF